MIIWECQCWIFATMCTITATLSLPSTPRSLSRMRIPDSGSGLCRVCRRMSWDLERMSDVRLLVLADVVGYRSWPAGPCPRSQRHVEEASGTGRGIRWQVAGGRRQKTGAGRREAEIGVHFLWGVPRCVERQEPGGRWAISY